MYANLLCGWGGKFIRGRQVHPTLAASKLSGSNRFGGPPHLAIGSTTPSMNSTTAGVQCASDKEARLATNGTSPKG